MEESAYGLIVAHEKVSFGWVLTVFRSFSNLLRIVRIELMRLCENLRFLRRRRFLRWGSRYYDRFAIHIDKRRISQSDCASHASFYVINGILEIGRRSDFSRISFNLIVGWRC